MRGWTSPSPLTSEAVILGSDAVGGVKDLVCCVFVWVPGVPGYVFVCVRFPLFWKKSCHCSRLKNLHKVLHWQIQDNVLLYKRCIR